MSSEGWYNAIFNRIKIPKRLKSAISSVVSHNYAKLKIDSDDSPLEKPLTSHDVVTINKLVFDKNQNKYYYNWLEKNNIF